MRSRLIDSQGPLGRDVGPSMLARLGAIEAPELAELAAHLEEAGDLVGALLARQAAAHPTGGPGGLTHAGERRGAP